MKNINFRVLLSAICMASILAGFTKVNAAPIRFDQVVQIINARPGKAETARFSRLRVSDDYTFLVSAGDDEDKKKGDTNSQDDRVQTQSTSEIVEDDVCDCNRDDVKKRCSRKWLLLGLAAIPIAFILIKRDKDTPTPTPTQTVPVTQTPTPPPMTPTPTPPMTPTPTPPEPVPEPMTILLFGTGLATIGLAARRRFGKRGESEGEKETE